MKNGNNVLRYFSIITLLLGVLAVSLSGSRAGILSLCVIALVVAFYSIKLKKHIKVIAFCSLIVVCIVGLYFIKKDSADGRLLIWQVSTEMIKDKPLGFGIGGFRANYMNYQADFFAQNPDSKFAMIADNIKNPFNEYLLLVTNFGIVGLVAFLAFVCFIFYCYKKSHFEGERCFAPTSYSMLSLIAIAVFSFFSYPFCYAFVWLVFAANVLIIIYNARFCHSWQSQAAEPSAREGGNPSKNRGLWVVDRKDRFVLKTTLLALCVIIGFFTYRQMRNEMFWCKIANKSLAGQNEEMLPYYAKLHNSLKNNYLFLYNYTAELNFAEKYEESLQIAKDCEQLWADYDLQMLMADNYLQMKQYEKAEQHYKKAAAMCPVRFMPLYSLVELYITTGRTAEAEALAKKVLDKKVKIPSVTINAIKNKMREILSEYYPKEVPPLTP